MIFLVLFNNKIFGQYWWIARRAAILESRVDFAIAIWMDLFICSVCCFNDILLLDKINSDCSKKRESASNFDEYRDRIASIGDNGLFLLNISSEILGRTKLFSHSLDSFRFRLWSRRLGHSKLDEPPVSKRSDSLIPKVVFSSLPKENFDEKQGYCKLKNVDHLIILVSHYLKAAENSK
jgi:hypothetical protein